MTNRQAIASLRSYVLVAVGGFAGATVRHGTEAWLHSLTATLAVNVTASIALGFLLFEDVYVGALSRSTRTALGTGFLSSLSTYSTFALQTVQSAPVLAASNVTANYALGIAGVLLGRRLALALAGRVRA